MTLLLIGANLLAAYAGVLDPTLIRRFGFVPGESGPFAAFTSLFLHANTLHLLGNMVFLAAVGASVELATGSLRFALVFLVSGLVGVGAHALLASGNAPLVGASGAVAGCVGYYSLRYLALRVPLAPKLAVPIAAVIGLWAALQVVGAFVRIGDTSAGTAYWAHLGGFAAGVLLSLTFRAPDLGQQVLDREVLGRMEERSAGATVAAAKRYLERHPRDADAWRRLAEAHQVQDEPTEEAAAWLQFLEIAPETDQPQALARLHHLNALPTLPAVRRLLLADRFSQAAPDVSRTLLLSVAAEGDPDQSAEALFSLAALEQAEHREAAGLHLQELADRYPLHPATERARARGWLP